MKASLRFIRWGLCLALWGQAMAQNASPTLPTPYAPLSMPLGDILRTLPPHSLQQPAEPVPADCAAAWQDWEWAETKVLRLSEAIDRGLCRSTRAQSGWAAIKREAGTLGEAQATLFPSLRASITRNKVRNEYIYNAANNEQGISTTFQVSLSHRLFDARSRELSRDAAQWALEATLYGYDVALSDTMLAIVGAYYEALSQQSNAHANALALRVSRDIYETSVRREQKGLGSHNETLQSKTAWLRAELDHKKSQAEQYKSQDLLRYQMGEAGIERRLIPLEDEAQIDEFNLEELEHWYRLALVVHPSLSQTQAGVKSALAKLAATERELSPTVDANLNRNMVGLDNPASVGINARRLDTSLGVTINLPLFEGFAWNYRVLGAKSRVEQAESEARDARHRVVTEIARTYHDVLSLRNNLNHSEQLLASAEETFKSARNRLEHGVADIIEVLNAQKALSDARRERIQNLSNWRVARLKLRIQTGIFERLAQKMQR